MTNDTNSKRPTHRVFHEVKNKDGKTVRSDAIGAIWPKRSGKGFNQKLDYIPVNFSGWLDIQSIEDAEEAQGGRQ